jgi:hypothetical protein
MVYIETLDYVHIKQARRMERKMSMIRRVMDWAQDKKPRQQVCKQAEYYLE